jgi:hypothetical protein
VTTKTGYSNFTKLIYLQNADCLASLSWKGELTLINKDLEATTVEHTKSFRDIFSTSGGMYLLTDSALIYVQTNARLCQKLRPNSKLEVLLPKVLEF